MTDTTQVLEETTESTQEEVEAKDDVVQKEPQTFKPITTQEQLDSVIAARIYRERAKYEGFDEYKQKAAQYDDMASKIVKYEEELAAYRHEKELSSWKEEVSKETGVPAQALKGSTKEELMEHAQILKDYLAPSAPVIGTDGKQASVHTSDELMTIKQLFRR